MINQPLEDRMTPLSIGIDNKDLEFVRFALDLGADPSLELSSEKYNGMSPIHIATTLGFVEAIQPLLDRGADINKMSVSSKKPINYACEAEDARTVYFLVAAGAEITERDHESCRLLQRGGYHMRKKKLNKHTRKRR